MVVASVIAVHPAVPMWGHMNHSRKRHMGFWEMKKCADGRLNVMLCLMLAGRAKSKAENYEISYRKLADQMEIPMHECHFGYFDMAQLKQAYDILKEWRG